MLFLSLFVLSCAAATDYNQLLQSPSALLNAYNAFRVENPSSHGESALRLKLFRNTVKLIAQENNKHQGYEQFTEIIDLQILILKSLNPKIKTFCNL